jgi:drug/metabolite transporter (DMT)-like permease
MNAGEMKGLRTSAARGYGTILLSSLLYGTYGVWSRLMGDTFQPFYQAWVRSLIIMLLMLPPMLARGSFRRIERRDWPQVGIYLGFCVFTQAPLYYAFNHAPIGTVQLIFYSLFIITAYIVGRGYLGERITRAKLFAMALAFVGMAIIFGVSVLTFAPLGLALAALNGVASGGEISSSKKVSEKYPPALLVFLGWACTFATHLPISIALGETLRVPQFSTPWLWLTAYSLVNAAAFWLSIVGFKSVDASIGSLVGLMEAVFSLMFGAVIFHQALSWSVVVGGSFILLAAMWPDLSSRCRASVAARSIERLPELIKAHD